LEYTSNSVALLKLRVVPNARRSEVMGAYGEAVKVKVATPAVDGKANVALLEFLAQKLGVPVRTLKLAAGEKSRNKLLEISDLDTETARGKLLA
jgi:uncharacterized protein (TIGR00251 family)